MQVSVEELSPVQKKINIEIPAERVNEEIEKAYSSLQKKAKIQGFRPGKVPMNLIKRTYSGTVRDDIMRYLYDQTLYKALIDNKISPLDTPTIESEILEHGLPFKYSAFVEVMPRILLKNYTRLEVNKEKYVFNPNSIDEELARMQEKMAQLIPENEHCCVEKGHSVSIDYSFSVEGLPEESTVAEDAIVEVGANKLIPAFEEQLVGMKTGETREFSIDLPKDYLNADTSGKLGFFKVMVKEIKRKELPELDDEFAQQFGEYDTMIDLRAKMVEYHEKHELERIENELKGAVLKALIEKNPLDVPESLVKRQLDVMLDDLKNRLKSKQSSMDNVGIDDALFCTRFHDDAAEKVRAGLLLLALVEIENISVSDEELNERYEKIAAGNPDMLSRIKEYYSTNSSAKNAIISEIKEDKAISLLIDKAVITEADSAELKAA